MRISIVCLLRRVCVEVRDLVLNHASITPPDPRSAIEWICDLVEGISGLRKFDVVGGPLIRCSTDAPMNLWYFQCEDGYLVRDVFDLLRSEGKRDVSLRLQRLVNESLLAGQVPDIVEKFKSCEAEGCGSVSLTPDEGAPLLLCALTNGIAVSFPSQRIWSSDVLRVRYIEEELAEDGNFHEHSETVDNLSQSVQAQLIIDRHRESIRNCTGPRDLWLRRGELFPHITFGRDVESQLNRIDNRRLGSVITRLTELDKTVAEWRDLGTPCPRWRSKVSPETKADMNQSKWRDVRTFRTSTGGTAVFEWHARFGKRRIHFTFDHTTRELEVGYIGPKLPPLRH